MLGVLCDGVDMKYGSGVEKVSSIEVKQSRGAETRLNLPIFFSAIAIAVCLRFAVVFRYSVDCPFIVLRVSPVQRTDFPALHLRRDLQDCDQCTSFWMGTYFRHPSIPSNQHEGSLEAYSFALHASAMLLEIVTVEAGQEACISRLFW